MDELHSILADHHSRLTKAAPRFKSKKLPIASTSEIPDIFFDEILVKNKLSRVEIVVFMYLYRHVWCRPNLYKDYGLSQVLSHNAMAESLGVEMEELQNSLRKLESFAFIETIRLGQYFVRRYFTEDFDRQYGQSYDNF